MHRSAVIVVMLLAMLWQSVALARPGSSVNVLADMAHTALHLLGESHHHDEDGGYQLDDSQEAVHHVVSDHACCAAAALLPSSVRAFPPPGATAPGDRHLAPVPEPDLEGLLRPPRFRA